MENVLFTYDFSGIFRIYVSLQGMFFGICFPKVELYGTGETAHGQESQGGAERAGDGR